MNVNHRLNDIESHENFLDASTHEQNNEMESILNNGIAATTKEMPMQETGSQPNEGILYSNSFAENGMLINGRNNNDHHHKNSNNEIAMLARRNEANENHQKLIQRNLMQMHEENADIEQAKHSSVLSPILKGNQELDNVSGKMILANITGHAFKEDTFGFTKELNKTNTKEMMMMMGINAIDNGNVRNVNTTVDGYIHENNSKQTQQINKMATFAIQTNGTEKPLIGSLTQNVSIIDNEHQFERYNNVVHSMNVQKPTENKTTKLQSVNDNVHANIEDRYDNGKGSIGNISENSSVHGVTEQWYDKCATSGHSGLFVVISIGISVLVTIYLVYVYRCKNLYNLHRIETIEQNRPAQNHLIGMQMEMEMLNSKIQYTDTPIDLW